jgi:hypothetical protein
MTTQADLTLQAGRQPFAYLEIDVEACNLTYGTAPCTATLGTTGTRACFNSAATCQAKNVVATHLVTKTLRFCDVAAGVSPAFDALPLVTAIDYAPTRINREEGIGARETVRIQLIDTTHNDVGFDPYLATRTYDPLAQSTFWPKFLARWPYLHLRPLRVYVGFLDAGGTVAGFQALHYVIDKVDGPDATGKVTITAKDVLALADDDKVKYPPARSGWELKTAISATDLTAELVSASDDDPTVGLVKIGDEVISFVRDGSTLISLVRGFDNTPIDEHDAKEKVQEVIQIAGRVDHVLADLLLASGVSPTYLPLASWDAEITTWLGEGMLKGNLSEPTGIKSLIQSICKQTATFLWWDARTKLVQLRCIRPYLDVEVVDLTHVDHLGDGKLALTSDPAKRVSSAWYSFKPIDWYGTGTDDSDFARITINSDPGAEDDQGLTWRSANVRTIRARLADDTGEALAATVTERLRRGFASPPWRLTATLDAKDAARVWAGTFVRITCRGLVDDTGTVRPKVFQVIEARTVHNGHALEITAESTDFQGRYSVYTADAIADYVINQIDHGYVSYYCNDFDLMPDGTDPYQYG